MDRFIVWFLHFNLISLAGARYDAKYVHRFIYSCTYLWQKRYAIGVMAFSVDWYEWGAWSISQRSGSVECVQRGGPHVSSMCYLQCGARVTGAMGQLVPGLWVTVHHGVTSWSDHVDALSHANVCWRPRWVSGNEWENSDGKRKSFGKNSYVHAVIMMRVARIQKLRLTLHGIKKWGHAKVFGWELIANFHPFKRSIDFAGWLTSSKYGRRWPFKNFLLI